MVRSVPRRRRSMIVVLWFVVAAMLATPPGWLSPETVTARQAENASSPIDGEARVIAQGVVVLPTGEAVWRTVRTRAAVPADAGFEARPLGFVLATSGALLLVDRESGEQVRLGTGEAALVREGTVQQRSSLSGQPVSYLSIELVASDAAAPPDDAIVLQPGQPFAAPGGLHDLDLFSAALRADETFTLPDTGAKNVILITDGAAAVGRPGGDFVILLAGEAASFSGELQVAVAPDGGDESRAAFVVGTIGPEVAPPPLSAESVEDAPAATAAPGTPSSTAGGGSITIQVFTCPPGMTAETVAAAACAPAAQGFEVTLSGENLAAPLTLGDAAMAGDSYTWSDLPSGEYVIAQSTAPAGATSYILSAREATGDPDTGYRITIDAANSTLSLRIYNFTPA